MRLCQRAGSPPPRPSPHPLLFPLLPGVTRNVGDPWRGPSALTSPFLPLFLQLLLKMIGLMTC